MDASNIRLTETSKHPLFREGSYGDSVFMEMIKEEDKDEMCEVDMGPLELTDEEKQYKIIDINTGKMYDVRDIRQVAKI